MSVVIVGGGWAGLAAAVQLTLEGVPVTLLESAKQLGGRARCAPFGEHRVDNGQHIMIGAYTHVLGMMKIMNVDIDATLLRMPLSLHMRSLKKGEVIVKGVDLPAPFNILAAILRARGLSLFEKQRAIHFCLRLALAKFNLKEDVSVEALLIRHRQIGRLTDTLWEPLCLATLNTPIRYASALVFLRVLRDAFSQYKNFSDLLIARESLCKIFPEPAMEYIERNAGHVNLQKRVIDIHIDGNQLTGIQTDDGLIRTNRAILALPPHALIPLIDNKPVFASLKEKLHQFTYEPIVTVYLQYPLHAQLDSPVIGATHSISQWIFDRRVAGQPGLMAVVISASQQYRDMNNTELEQRVSDELAKLFPDWPKPDSAMTIREKRATFASTVNIDKVRPVNKTAVAGCYVAGDFTDTSYPATLEGAVMSGIRAARLLLKEYPRP